MARPRRAVDLPGGGRTRAVKPPGRRGRVGSGPLTPASAVPRMPGCPGAISRRATGRPARGVRDRRVLAGPNAIVPRGSVGGSGSTRRPAPRPASGCGGSGSTRGGRSRPLPNRRRAHRSVADVIASPIGDSGCTPGLVTRENSPTRHGPPRRPGTGSLRRTRAACSVVGLVDQKGPRAPAGCEAGAAAPLSSHRTGTVRPPTDGGLRPVASQTRPVPRGRPPPIRRRRRHRRPLPRSPPR